jgi:hypothetical protein
MRQPDARGHVVAFSEVPWPRAGYAVVELNRFAIVNHAERIHRRPRDGEDHAARDAGS